MTRAPLSPTALDGQATAPAPILAPQISHGGCGGCATPRSDIRRMPDAGGRAMSLDPVTLAVIQAGLQQVCDEMDLTFSRAAFSPVIAEADDRSDGIYSAEDGSLIAQGSRGLPVFVGTMQFSTRHIVERIAAGETLPPEPGDIYIVNDPYLGGTHLMDVRFATPVLARRADLVLAVEYRPLARYRRRGAGRVFRQRHLGRAGGAAAAAGEAVQARGDGCRTVAGDLLEHPGVGTADRRREGAGRRRCWSAPSGWTR